MQVSCFDCTLRACGLFKPITTNELGAINEIKRDHLVLPAGAEIIRAGEDCPEIYTLYSGWAFRFKLLPDGRRQILNFLLPGDLVGLQAAMFDAAQHGIEALTEVQLCLLPRRKVWGLFGEMPGLAFDVAWLGSREESHVDENLTSAGRRTATERTAALIVMLYKRAKALGLVDERHVPVSIDATAHRRRARDVAGAYQQDAGAAAEHGHVRAHERLADFDQSARAGEDRAIFRRGNSAAAVDLRDPSRRAKSPAYERGISPSFLDDQRENRYFAEASGTQAVLSLSYLNPGADFSASLLAFMVR